MASASMVISTRSPTTIPPWSNCAFQLTPKSCRFIVVVAVKPARVLGPLSTPLSHQGVCHSPRSEEHTSELQSRLHLVCRLLLEKKKKRKYSIVGDKRTYGYGSETFANIKSSAQNQNRNHQAGALAITDILCQACSCPIMQQNS